MINDYFTKLLKDSALMYEICMINNQSNLSIITIYLLLKQSYMVNEIYSLAFKLK